MRSYRVPAVPPPARGVARLLMAAGTALLLLAGAVTAYPRWAEWQYQLHQPPRPAEALPVAAPAATERGALADPAAPAPAQPRNLLGRPTWITIPRIKVDTSITEVHVEDGAYQVPAFDVGHHDDSVNPGDVGNSIFNGHLTTIDAGRVFAELHQVAVGDAVQVYTPMGRSDWVIEDARVVPATDTSFILPTTDTRITLYTCAGTFDPRTHDYTHRLVLVGKLTQVVPRSA
jgi:LPXTG-site transpeptidase (sortase) family protein